jgi:hypothetical protein
MLSSVLVLLSIIYLVKLITTKEQGWKIKKGENFTQIYSELDNDGNWRSISFDCEQYAKNVPRHALIIDKNWNNYPEWAATRKQEILDRLRSVLREPEYTIIER